MKRLLTCPMFGHVLFGLRVWQFCLRPASTCDLATLSVSSNEAALLDVFLLPESIEAAPLKQRP